jgi:hypothetical protein
MRAQQTLAADVAKLVVYRRYSVEAAMADGEAGGFGQRFGADAAVSREEGGEKGFQEEAEGRSTPTLASSGLRGRGS